MNAARFTISPDGKSITCHRCGLTSHNPNDVKHRYCGHCHVFYDSETVRHFDCDECGRYIISICGPPVTTCAACMSMPGWFNDPEIAHLIDPDYRRNPKVLQ